MPIQIYRRQNNPNDSIAQAIIAGTNGFVQGRQMRQQSEDQAISNAYRQAQIQELQRKSEALSAPAPSGYVRDPYSGQLKEDLTNEASQIPTGYVKAGKRYVKDPNYFNPNVIQQKEAAKGIPVSETGKYTFAQEAENNLPQALKTLFPTGTPESFRRDYAFASKTPGPKLLGGGKALPLSKEGQNVKRWLGSALAGRLLIQSGAQTNPAEYERLADDYLASVGSNPSAIYQGINELLAFHKGYERNLKTRGAEGYQPPSYDGLPQKQNSPQAGLPAKKLDFNSEEEALSSGAKGEVLINGRRAVID